MNSECIIAPLTVDELKSLTIEDLMMKYDDQMKSNGDGTINTGWTDFWVGNKLWCVNLKIECFGRPQSYIDDIRG